MQDPRFCSACGAGPFVHIQNHLNKCKASQKQEITFLDASRGVKWHDLAPDMEVLRQRRQPPDLTPQVRANRFLMTLSDRRRPDPLHRSGGFLPI